MRARSRYIASALVAFLSLSFFILQGAYGASCNVRNSAGCDAASGGGRALQDEEDPRITFRFNMFSYTVDGAYQWIYDWGPFDLIVKTDVSKLGDVNSQIEIEFKGVNTHKVVYGRDGASIFLASSTLITPAAGTPQELAAENRLLWTLQGAKTISFGDRRLTVTGAKYSAYFDRIPLAEPVVGQEWDGLQVEGNVLKVVPATYFYRGEFSTLFTDGSEFPINVELAMDAEDEVIVVLRFVDIASYRIKYNVADGWVEKVVPMGVVSNGATAIQQAVGKKIVDIIGNVQQIAFESSYLVQFITDNGSTRISFAFEKGSARRLAAADVPNVRYVAPESYTVKGAAAKLYSGAPTPITLEFPQTSVGSANFTLVGGVSQNFLVKYNNADGWVSGVTVGKQVQTVPQPATRDDAAEKKIRDIIANVQQVAFESDGRVQFVTDSGASRISFTVSPPRKLAAASGPKTLALVPETYTAGGSLGGLFGSGASFPITVTLTPSGVGTVIADVKAINSMRFTYNYNNADGWVNSITPGVSTLVAPADGQQQQAEERVRYIMSSANQIAFEADGRVQFIADYGATRVAFDPTTSTSTATPVTSTTTIGFNTLSSQVGTGSLSVEPYSYVLDGVAAPLYDGAVFPITVSIANAGTGMSVVTLYAVDTTQYTVNYNEKDGWVNNVSRQYIGVGNKSLDQLTTAAKIQNILANLQQLAFEADGSVQFISKGATSRVLFKPGTHSRRRLASADVTSLYVDVESYQKSGAPAALFSAGAFPVTLTVESTGVGAAKLTVAGVNTYGFDVKYNNADGWVNSITTTSSTNAVVSSKDKESMDRIVSAVANAQQIAFQVDGRVQFISNHGADRLSFLPTPPSVKRDVIPGSYVFRGASAKLYGTETFPITLVTEQKAVGLLVANLTAVNTVSYTVAYNNADGWVGHVNHTTISTGTGSEDRKATEKKIVDILANVQQLGFESDGTLQIITDSGASRVSFGAQGRRRLAAVLSALPETYQMGGSSATLFAGPAFPITLETTSTGVGQMEFVVKAVNSMTYNAKYNAADGWVSSISLLSETRMAGTQQQMDTENKVKKLIGTAQQIAFESDGRIQFIGANGGNRLTFADHPNPALSVAAESYQTKGTAAALYEGSAFPITLEVANTGTGKINATLHAVNTISYDIQYNNADGWVSSVSHKVLKKGSGSAAQSATETKLVNILANVQQVAFENDGRVQFITDSGATRVSFTPSTARRLQATETRQAVAATYQVNGVPANLYVAGVAYPVYLETSSAGVGALDVTVRVTNSYNFRLYYNNADGWVSSVIRGPETLMLASPAQADVEAKIVTLISNTQQVAFETDGRVQFIANHGADRITFDYPTMGGSSLEPTKRYVVPASYVFRGAFAQLYVGDAYPITLEEVASTVGDLNVTVSAVQKISYRIQFDNANGVVKSVAHSTISTGSGTAAANDAETKIKNIIANVQQVVWGTKGDVTFITDSGNTRITFSTSSRRRLQEVEELTFKPSSFKIAGQQTSLFSGETPNITATAVTLPGDATKVNVTLTAAGKTGFNFFYNPADGMVYSVERRVIEEPAADASAELIAADGKLVDVVSGANVIRFGGDGSVTFSTAGRSEVTFAAAKKLEWERREVASETYTVDNTAKALFTGEAYPITVDVASVAEGEVEVVLNAVNTLRYTIAYNETDGWVTEVTPLAETAAEGDTKDLEAEVKIKDIIGAVQQLAFEEDGRLQFITAHGATRVSFDRPAAVPVMREVAAATYQKDGKAAPLFDGESYPVKLETLQVEEGKVAVTLHSRNVYLYEYVYNATDGWVKSVKPGTATGMAVEQADAATEARLTALVGNAKQLAFEDDGRLQFLANNGLDRLSFDLPARRRLAESKTLQLLPETYTVNKKQEDVFKGPEFPVTVSIETAGVGSVTVLLNALSTTRFDIKYNNADGWVSSVSKSVAAQRTGTKAQTEAESRLVDLLATTQQIAFEADGRVQFITADGASRVTFGAAADEMLEVVASTYQTAGAASTLYTGEAFPMSVEIEGSGKGAVNVTFHAVNSIVYDIKYNNADGWVESVKHRVVLTGKGTEDQTATETKIVNILANVQQVAFEKDGRVQFITDKGASRITFAPASKSSARRMLVSVMNVAYTVEPSTYQQNGEWQTLFDNVAEFPVTVTVSNDGDSENIDLTAVNTWRFKVDRDRSTGVVSSVGVSKILEASGTEAQLAVETKLKNILANAQTIHVSSNTVAVIADNYNTRINFLARINGTVRPWISGQTLKPTNNNETVRPHFISGATLHPSNTSPIPPWYNETDVTLDGKSVAPITVTADPASFVANGTYQYLFDGQSFPISLTLSLSDAENLVAELNGVNTYRYAITWNPLGGQVSNVQTLSYQLRVGDAVQASDEGKVNHILANVETVTFSPQQAVVLSADHLTSRLLFRNTVVARRLQASQIEVGRESHKLLPESYRVNGQATTLLPNNYPYNVTVAVELQGVGKARVTLNALNSYVYDFSYNNADGWVNSKTLVSQTKKSGTAEQQAVDTKLNAVIGNTQQIAFETDGRVQFITDQGASRVAFDKGDAVYAIQGNYVASNTYTTNGAVQPLYVGTAFPISLAAINDEVNGVLNVTMSGVNVVFYSYKYNKKDGWVTSKAKTATGTLIGAADQTWKTTEERVTSVLDNVQQIVFEADKRLTFTKDNGASRITFNPTSNSRRLSTTRLAVAGTYQVNGSDAKLYEGSYFPIALDYVQTGVGAATMTVRGLPGTRTFEVNYNNADGWVNSVVLVSSAVGNVPAEQQISFDRVVSLVGKVQQLGFHDDNRLQIITDNGASRITFN